MGGAGPSARGRVEAEDGYLEAKAERLRGLLRNLGPVLVAFSGGVDSTTLLHAARETLGKDSVLAVTAHGDVHTGEELDIARAAATRIDVRHLVVETHELALPGFADNPPDRCYICKHALYTRLSGLAAENRLKTVVDGCNADDMHDYRPGLKATAELGVRSPLADVGLGKAEVRVLAQEWGLPECDRASSPCLASRFPYGEGMSREDLRRVGEAESYLRGLGLEEVRVRHHGNVARIEVAPIDMARAVGCGEGESEAASTRRAIVEHLRGLGYTYVALDLQGFRSGSLNEAMGFGTAQGEEQ